MSKQRWAIAEASDRNADALRAMGFAHRFTRRLEVVNNEHITANERLSDVTGGLSVVSADGRSARFATGANGALAAFNVLLNAYAPGDAVTG